VYTIGFCPPDAAEYAHIAGRTGRVGQAGRGQVTCVLGSSEEVASVRGLVEGALGRKLMVWATTDVEAMSAGESMDDLIQRLEDGLMLDAEDPRVGDGNGDDSGDD